jgi:hypothetical protein
MHAHASTTTRTHLYRQACNATPRASCYISTHHQGTLALRSSSGLRPLLITANISSRCLDVATHYSSAPVSFFLANTSSRWIDTLISANIPVQTCCNSLPHSRSSAHRQWPPRRWAPIWSMWRRLLLCWVCPAPPHGPSSKPCLAMSRFRRLWYLRVHFSVFPLSLSPFTPHSSFPLLS